MARILYGVHGTGHGHAIRALSIARHFPEHQFLFVSHAQGASLLRQEYPVFECPNPETVISSHRVRAGSTAASLLGVLRRQDGLMEKILGLISEFRPHAAFTDYEYFVPRACLHLGIPCLSIDNQHVILVALHGVPLSQLPSLVITTWSIRMLFSKASSYLIPNFFPPLPSRKPPFPMCVVPPLLRESVAGRKSCSADHVVAYQGYSTFRGFFSFLKAIPRQVRVYGFGQRPADGNLLFRPYSEGGFLEDLGSCAYVICGGGHTAISEALYFGKPILSFPIANAFEQFLNAHFVERLGYGRCVTALCPRPQMIKDFEDSLEQYHHNIKGGNFNGNQQVFEMINGFISTGALP